MRTSIFRNRIAIVYWAFAAIWMAFLVAFTWLMARDGAPEGYAPEFMLLLLALFWLGGFGLTAHAASHPCYVVTVQGDGMVTFTWRFVHKTRRRSYPASALSEPVVVTEKGSDGEDYFVLRIRLPDGSTARLAEAHDRQRCEEALDTFTRAIGGDEPGPRG